MTLDEFRTAALSLEGAIEGSHHDTADFRVNGRLFATLGWPDDGWAVVMLTPDERDLCVEAAPDVFSPVPGGWGRTGHTRVLLKSATTSDALGALQVAWRIRLDKPKARARKG